jgi:hypothetical protein
MATPPPPAAQPIRAHSGPILLALVALTALALVLRTYRTDVPFQSGDHATMPYMVSCWFGVSWIIAHTYGPLLPAIVWPFAKAVVALGLVMDEAMWRLPLALIGTLQVPITYLLMQRLGGRPWTALLAAAYAAVLPLLACDARYTWGYETLGLCVGSVAIWAWLRDLDQPTWFGRWLAGGLLGLYLLSHLTIHAVPLIIVAAVIMHLGFRRGLRRLLQPATLLPVALAAALTLYAYFGLDGGILGRMSHHTALGTLHPGAYTVSDLWHLARLLIGPVWAVFSAIAVIVGLVLIARRDRRGLPALWAAVYLAPLVMLLNVNNIGRPAGYQVQWVFAASCSACLLLQLLVERSTKWTRPARAAISACAPIFAVLIFAAHLLGSASNLFTDRRWPMLTGTVDYGAAVPDPGYKAAGWYVRAHVPANAVIFATHENVGLEYPTATYYTGRHVAAAEDTTYEQECRLIEAVTGDIDVAIVEPRYLARFAERGFDVPVSVMRDGDAILYIAARPGYSIPAMDVEATDGNARFDKDFALQRVPTPVRQLSRTREVNRRIAGVLSADKLERNAKPALADAATDTSPKR